MFNFTFIIKDISFNSASKIITNLTITYKIVLAYVGLISTLYIISNICINVKDSVNIA
jgi:hypothetical protein